MGSGMKKAEIYGAARRHHERGFTLVEVIVVLSVVLLLTGIAVPMLSSYMEDGRRARAQAEAKVLGASVMSFYKDVGAYPTKNSAGTNSYLYVLFSGSALPTTSPWAGGHTWISWGMSARGDVLDNHLLNNQPQGATSAAYATTGSAQWRGPYVAGSTPMDPWGRPYIINVVSATNTSATNYKRVYVISAGANGRFDTSANATSTTEITGDDVGIIMHQRP